MDSVTVQRLLALNRDFYTRFSDSFSATRHRIQPGVRRALEMLKGDQHILDLGCGNGKLVRVLAKRGHRGAYLGLDFSLPLLREAEAQSAGFSATFHAMDIATLATDRQSQDSTFSLDPSSFDIVFSFAVFHHIPSRELRSSILRAIHQLLKPDGLFIHSNWQFLNSEKLKARIQPWETVAISESELESGDYLLDWRSGGTGLRYVHHFEEDELGGLAKAAGFKVVDTFYSDGETGNLGLYQAWKPLV